MLRTLRDAATYAVADMRTAADQMGEPTDRRYAPLRRAADRLAVAIAAVDELRRPVVVDATGEDTWTIVVPGFGEPRFYRIEFDHDADLRYQTEQWGEYAAALAALRASGLGHRIERGVEAERERLREYIATMDATLAELDVAEGWDTIPADYDR